MSSLLREDLKNGQVMLSNEIASIVIHRDLLPGLNLKKVFKPMQVQHSEALLTNILDDLDASRNEFHPEVEILPEPPIYTGHLCSIREERPRVQEDSFLNLLITGAMFR